MTYEEVKSMLKNFCSKKERLITLKSYIDAKKALIDGVGAVNYDKLKVNSSPGNSTEERYIRELDRLKDLQQRFEMLMEDMSQEEKTLLDMMSALTPTEYNVILNRFFMGYKPHKTAKLIGYSLDGLYDIQERAIKKMSQYKSSQ